VRAAGTACLDAGTECLFDDGVDGARATTAIGAATEAAIELLCISRQGPAAAHGIADVVVAEDVTGTNDHLRGGSGL
jgi:hypothetical protein